MVYLDVSWIAIYFFYTWTFVLPIGLVNFFARIMVWFHDTFPHRMQCNANSIRLSFDQIHDANYSGKMEYKSLKICNMKSAIAAHIPFTKYTIKFNRFREMFFSFIFIRNVNEYLVSRKYSRFWKRTLQFSLQTNDGINKFSTVKSLLKFTMIIIHSHMHIWTTIKSKPGPITTRSIGSYSANTRKKINNTQENKTKKKNNKNTTK